MIKALKTIHTVIFEEAENKALALMIFGGFSFATMGALTHSLGQRCDWMIIVVFRMLATFVITVFASIKSGLNPFVLNRSLLWFRSVVGSGAMLATFYALTQLPVSDVTIITETRPIWVALLAGLVLGESPTRRVWFSILLGIAGVTLVEKPHIVQRNYAALFALFASFLGAIVMICLRKLRDLDPRLIVSHFSGTATLVTLFLLFIFRENPNFEAAITGSNPIFLAGVGIFGTIGQLSMTKAFSLGKAPMVSTAGLIRVGFAAMYDLIIWNYVFHLSTIAGIVLILTSTACLFGSNILKINNINKTE